MSAKRTKATIKPSPCNISGEMGEKITALLEECNIQAVVVPDVVEEPIPLILPDDQNIGQQDTEVETGALSDSYLGICFLKSVIHWSSLFFLFWSQLNLLIEWVYMVILFKLSWVSSCFLSYNCRSCWRIWYLRFGIVLHSRYVDFSSHSHSSVHDALAFARSNCIILTYNTSRGLQPIRIISKGHVLC